MRLEDAKAIRNACLKNAKDLLQASKLILEKGLPHIAYNLAALAMEEIGKASMVESNYLNSNIEEEVYDVAADDHVRKLFWAIWSPGFLRGKITVQQLESTKDLASIIHERRLRYLYVDPSTPSLRGQEMIPGEVEQLIALAETRHSLETSREIIDINSPEANDLKWFYCACKDVEKRKYIFSQAAIDKLAEFGSSKDWISWLKQVFEKHDKEMLELAQKELSRSKPDPSEANAPKWKIRVRLETPSHSVRPKALAKWNKISDFIKLYPTDDKHELICEFTLSKSYPIASLWQGGWLSSKLFAVALNIATRGFFWWHVDKDIERFYEDILDVETNTHLRVERNPRLAVNWQELRLTLREDDMPLVGIVFGYLARISEIKGKEAFESYAAGVTFLSKTDIHLQLEANAFEEFFKALKTALIFNHDWDGTSAFIEAAKSQFQDVLRSTDELEKILKLGLDFEQDKGLHRAITLTEAFGMKLYCDLYFMKLANIGLAAENSKISNQGENKVDSLIK